MKRRTMLHYPTVWLAAVGLALAVGAVAAVWGALTPVSATVEDTEPVTGNAIISYDTTEGTKRAVVPTDQLRTSLDADGNVVYAYTPGASGPTALWGFLGFLSSATLAIFSTMAFMSQRADERFFEREAALYRPSPTRN